jgi:spermidine synthase
VLESQRFYDACRACLRSPGVLTVNLFGAHASFDRNMRTLKAAFDGRVIALPEVHEGNRVAVAFNGPPLHVRWTTMRERAALLARTLKLPASAWIDGLRESSLNRGSGETAFRI